MDIFFSGSFNLRATFCLLSFGDSQELDRTAHARSLWFGPFQIGAGAFFLEHSVGARRPTGNFRPKLGVQLVALLKFQRLEPENHPIEKENHIPHSTFLGFSGVYPSWKFTCPRGFRGKEENFLNSGGI